MANRADVVRIASGEERGSGFLVDDSHVFTALHVIGRAADGSVVPHGPVRVEGARADLRAIVATEIEIVLFDAAADWVCFRVEGFAQLARPRLREVRSSDLGAAWHTYGFPDSAAAAGKAAGGTIRALEAEVRVGGESRPVIQLFSAEAGAGDVPGGFSGGPVFVDDEIIGFLVLAANCASSGTMYALPVGPLRKRLAGPHRPRALTLVYAEHSAPDIAAAGALVTDEPDALSAAVAAWPEWLATSAPRTDAERERIRAAPLAELLASPQLRQALLERRLAPTSFELYVYHAATATPAVRGALLFQRLRKVRPPTVRIESRVDLSGDVVPALAQILAEDRRIVAPPAFAHTRAPLADLADLALAIVARRIAAPDDGNAASEFESVRMHLRLALNVVTGRARRLEHDPL
jgi:hypothetical protein